MNRTCGCCRTYLEIRFVRYLPFLLALFCSVTCGVPVGAAASPGNSSRIIEPFNTDWLFAAGEIPQGASVHCDERQFSPVCLPHTVVPVPHTAIDTSAYAMLSWYRRRFVLPKAYAGKRVCLSFEGVAKAATVYCNGIKAGEYLGAYTPFTCDITPLVRFGSDNVVAVRVDSRQRKDIPPEGSYVDYLLFGGIVRDVNLLITDPLQVERVYARTDTSRDGRIALTVRVANHDEVERSGTVTTAVADSTGTVLSSVAWRVTLPAGKNRELQTVLGPVTKPHWWHPDQPYLYRIITTIADSLTTLDRYALRFGMRTVAFSKENGVFYLNGSPLKLRGLNRHETFPFIGRAASNRLQRRDAGLLKYRLGCNVVRCSHYPQDPAFLDRCDEIGLMVLEEMAGWNFVSGKKKWQAIALDNLSAMVLRDRNRPSVISFGVRINQSADYHEFYAETNRIARTLDPGRPTHGVRVRGRGSPRGFLEDVWAQNFMIPTDTPPVLPWITTESVGHLCPTHAWDDDSRLLRQMLMHAVVQDSAASNPMIAGILGWCAFDYNTAYKYVRQTVAYHGVADMFRERKPAGWFFRSQANARRYGPVVYIAHSWEAPTDPNDVWVVSNCDSVELYVNGRSRGKTAPNAFLSLEEPLFVWRTVPFAKGELKAVGYIGSSAVTTAVRTTPGKPEVLTVSADDPVLATGGDMTRVLVTVIDRNGQIVPRTNNRVTVQVKGPVDVYGESPVALENGRIALYLKTRSHGTGRVVCSVKGKKLRSARTVVSVVSSGNIQ